MIQKEFNYEFEMPDLQTFIKEKYPNSNEKDLSDYNINRAEITNKRVKIGIEKSLKLLENSIQYPNHHLKQSHTISTLSDKDGNRRSQRTSIRDNQNENNILPNILKKRKEKIIVRAKYAEYPKINPNTIYDDPIYQMITKQKMFEKRRYKSVSRCKTNFIEKNFKDISQYTDIQNSNVTPRPRKSKEYFHKIKMDYSAFIDNKNKDFNDKINKYKETYDKNSYKIKNYVSVLRKPIHSPRLDIVSTKMKNEYNRTISKIEINSK